MDRATSLRRRLTEADLLCGTVALVRYARSGLPSSLSPPEAPGATLERLLASVEPADLTEAAGQLWARLASLWKRQAVVSWDTVTAGASTEAQRFASWAQEHGMAVAYQAPVAAGRILVHAAAMDTLERARQEGAEALEQANRAMQGVGGVM